MTTSTLTSRSLLTSLIDLRNSLTVDAVVTGLNGVAYLAAGSVLDEVLGIPAGWLHAIGAFLFVYAVVVWAIRTPANISRPLAYGVVVANAAWAIASVVAATVGWHSPSTVGTIWIVAQALVVGGFAELQVTALRRDR